MLSSIEMLAICHNKHWLGKDLILNNYGFDCKSNP